MPENTPTIYLAVGLLALVGALFGALGQIGTAALQRRHERRMRLDDSKRAAYVQIFVTLRGLAELKDAQRELKTKIAEIKEAVAAGAKGFSTDPSETLDDLMSRLNDRVVRYGTLSNSMTELNASAGLLAPKPVMDQLTIAVNALSALDDGKKLDLGPLQMACRKDPKTPG